MVTVCRQTECRGGGILGLRVQLCPVVGYHGGGGFRCFLQPLQTNSGVVSTSDEAATVVSFHILANSLFADHFFVPHCLVWTVEWVFRYLMSIEPCIIVIVDEWKTNLMSLAILFHLVCAQHVPDINISIFRSLRLCWWWCSFCRLKHKLCFSLQNEHHQIPAATKAPTHNKLRTRRPMW